MTVVKIVIAVTVGVALILLIAIVVNAQQTGCYDAKSRRYTCTVTTQDQSNIDRQHRYYSGTGYTPRGRGRRTR